MGEGRGTLRRSVLPLCVPQARALPPVGAGQAQRPDPDRSVRRRGEPGALGKLCTSRAMSGAGASHASHASQYGMTGSRSRDVGYAVGANGPRRATRERSRSMPTNLRYLGLDVHAETIAAAIAEPDGEVRALGILPNRPEAITKLIRKLEPRHGLHACYEAGPCGYVLYWQLTQLGVHCDVVAPTLVPTKPGDRIKTDRRDAARLARCYRAGGLTPVVSEVGTLSRFTHPRQLMGYSGTVPSEHSSGASVHRGAITKTGNAHLRRVLVEAAWAYRFPPRCGKALRTRQRGQPDTITA